MEARLNRVKAWLEEKTAGVEEDVRILDEYYQSSQWRSDFEADEAGVFLPDLPRGVLSEDAIYDVVTEYEELRNEMAYEEAMTRLV